jgi:hypothetical protein
MIVFKRLIFDRKIGRQKNPRDSGIETDLGSCQVARHTCRRRLSETRSRRDLPRRQTLRRTGCSARSNLHFSVVPFFCHQYIEQ